MGNQVLTNNGTFKTLEDFQSTEGLLTSKVNFQASIGSDNSILNGIPAGYMLANIIFVNKSSNSVTLVVGTTEGGSDLIPACSVSGNKSYTNVITKTYLTDTSVYISSLNWNAAIVDCYLILLKIL